MQPFDPIHSPLSGTSLIEAGAGTGKTYTIAILVLRLLLQKALPPEQILVVTFTTAATAELRARLRRRLQDAKRILQGQASDDAVLQELLENCGPQDIARDRLEEALANFDCLPVFTIHGFCQRILHEMAFETGSGFDTELITDATPVIQGLADDYWRKTWYDAPPERMSLALKLIKRPENLVDLYRRYALPDITILPDHKGPKAPSGEHFRKCWQQARRQWRQSRSEVLDLLTSPSLKANIYGSLERPPRHGGGRHQRDEKIQAWDRQLDRWFESAANRLPVPDGLAYFCQTKLDGAVKKGARGPRQAFFEVCDRLQEAARALEQEVRQWVVAWQARFFRYADQQLDRYKKENQVLFYDDLLLMVRDALRRDRHGRLRHLLRARYKAALIDEFQDTDTVQYTIFKNIFDAPGSSMFMIGDPKQAIYRFRGADIFTYLQAARNATRCFTLTRNWRSSPGMVQAVNTLFGQHPRPFLWPAIHFHPAQAAVAQPTPCLDDPPAPLTIWFLDNPTSASGRPAMNKRTASAQICRAVAGEVHRRVAGRHPDGDGISYKDMAIIVRTNRQAGEMKSAFAAYGIPAVVYNAGSVFHRPEALDLQRVLAAVADPGADWKL
ncbi:MAG: UvrD-helicase domain-containing protein, partial [Desulfobacterales bacterium]